MLLFILSVQRPIFGELFSNNILKLPIINYEILPLIKSLFWSNQQKYLNPERLNQTMSRSGYDMLFGGFILLISGK
jgi:hypothetical protein